MRGPGRRGGERERKKIGAEMLGLGRKSGMMRMRKQEGKWEGVEGWEKKRRSQQ